MAELLACCTCQTVIWAYDHQPRIDLRGICNMFKLPCPKCGAVGNFDGWGFKELTEESITWLENGGPVYDGWSALRAYAKIKGWVWEPSPDNTWFRRPERMHWTE